MLQSGHYSFMSHNGKKQNGRQIDFFQYKLVTVTVSKLARNVKLYQYISFKNMYTYVMSFSIVLHEGEIKTVDQIHIQKIKTSYFKLHALS